MNRLLKNSGSALVWALCAMMVLTLLVAGLLVLSTGYYNSALEDAKMQKAELLAKSGANFAVHMLDYTSEDYDKNWLPAEGKTKRIHLDGDVHGSVYATLYFTREKVQSENPAETPSTYVMKVTSVAECGSYTAKCSAAFYGFGGEGDIWEFIGYLD